MARCSKAKKQKKKKRGNTARVDDRLTCGQEREGGARGKVRERNTARLRDRNSAGEGEEKNVKELKTEEIKSLLIFLYTFLFKRNVLTE